MDKIEKIRQEIERRLDILTNVYAEQVERKDEEMMNYYHGKVIALEELRPFLDTLSEEPDKGLEEAAETHVKNKYNLTKLLGAEIREAVNDFIAGAEWQKSQMLKDAVEVGGVVIDNGSGGTIIDTQCGVLYLPPLVYAVGEKVRIVVLKEEE